MSPDERFVEEVMAWVMLKPGETADAEEIREFCRGKIAHYKIPRYVKVTGEFPMTVTGKIQKFRMREMAVEELGLQAASQMENRLSGHCRPPCPNRDPRSSRTCPRMTGGLCCLGEPAV